MKVIERHELRNLRDVRLVGKGGNEIVTAFEAWQRADAEGLDLVFVNEESTPPVVKIEDFKKLLFEKKKALSKGKKQKVELKEIQFKVNISDHDVQTKIANIEKFLQRGDKVKISVRLKGRERDHPQRAFELMERIIGLIQTNKKVSKMEGPIAMALLEPIAGAAKA